MCAAANAIGMRVVFLGEWGGGLSLGCATGALYHMAAFDGAQTRLQVVRQQQRRIIRGFSGTCKDYYEHARRHRELQIQEEQMRLHDAA
eukprot:589353-Pyramimonas_sp.AAC.1